MREFYTAHLEIKRDFTEDFQTHPYEAGWATEAIFFIRVESVTGNGATLEAAVQISPDGLNWVDEGTDFEPMQTEGLYFVRVKHFGGWLRLFCTVTGDEACFRPLINLCLKE